MSILRERHAKIIATLGPASDSVETIAKLVESGVDVFRLNFSHGSHDEHLQRIENIRAAEKIIGHPITILQDLQGPKIRTGVIDKAHKLEVGDSYTFDSNKDDGDATRCCLPHPEILEVLKVDDKIYINDGIIQMKVVTKNSDSVVCEVTSGGSISSRKGVNLPGVDLPFSAITKKDWKDLDFGLANDVDWVAVSFVQHPEDMLEVREKVGDKASILAKIEVPNAIDRLEAILEVSDALMVARGDLGVEMPLEEVPAIQKKIIRLCREAGKPVVVATQMLESMIHNSSPTRAEVSDVANATYEGADALMLSAESAAGDFPVEAVTMMNSVITRVEESSAWQPLMTARDITANPTINDAIATAAFHTADMVDACAIVTFTESGATSLRMSRQRPIQPILTITPYEKTARRMGIVWGVNSVVGHIGDKHADMVNSATSLVKEAGIGNIGESIVITAGVPFTKSGSTNLLRVANID